VTTLLRDLDLNKTKQK